MKKWEEQGLEQRLVALEEASSKLNCIGIADCPKCGHPTVAAGHITQQGGSVVGNLDLYFLPNQCLVCGTRLWSERRVVSNIVDSKE